MLQRWMDSQAHSKIIATNSVHQKKIKVEVMRKPHTRDVLESRNLDKFQRERERGGRKEICTSEIASDPNQRRFDQFQSMSK